MALLVPLLPPLAFVILLNAPDSQLARSSATQACYLPFAAFFVDFMQAQCSSGLGGGGGAFVGSAAVGDAAHGSSGDAGGGGPVQVGAVDRLLHATCAHLQLQQESVPPYMLL
jgi:hypothetical protein